MRGVSRFGGHIFLKKHALFRENLCFEKNMRVKGKVKVRVRVTASEASRPGAQPVSTKHHALFRVKTVSAKHYALFRVKTRPF